MSPDPAPVCAIASVFRVRLRPRARRGTALGTQRQVHREDAAHAGQVAHGQAAAVGAHALASDGQTQTDPRLVIAALTEWNENTLHVAMAQTAAMVAHFDENAVGNGMRRQGDGRMWQGELHGVADQIA